MDGSPEVRDVFDKIKDKLGKRFNVYDYVFSLEEQLRNAESQRELFQSKLVQLENENRRIKDEIDQIKNPPLVVGMVEEVIGEKAIIRNYTGIRFLVDIPEKFKQSIIPEQRVAMSQRSLAILDILPKYKDARATAMEIIEKPDTTFTNVGGLSQQIRELEETVILPLTQPELFEKLGVKPPNGILLHGVSGTGKTLLAKAVASKSNATFIKVVGSELVQKYIGEGAALVKDVFRLAQEKQPSIIFIDEIDSVGSVRINDATGGDREVYRTLMQLLAEMDGFTERQNIKIIGATNRIDTLDPALLRPGRFDRVIEVTLPTPAERKEIFLIHSKGMSLAKNIDFDELAALTDGATGADIRSICTEAGIFALRAKADKIYSSHFKEAISKVISDEDADSEDKASMGMLS